MSVLDSPSFLSTDSPLGPPCRVLVVTPTQRVSHSWPRVNKFVCLSICPCCERVSVSWCQQPPNMVCAYARERHTWRGRPNIKRPISYPFLLPPPYRVLIESSVCDNRLKAAPCMSCTVYIRPDGKMKILAFCRERLGLAVTQCNDGDAVKWF